MGIFSTKRKKKFMTAVQRMIPDDKIVLSSKSAVSNYLLASAMKVDVMAKSMPDYIIEASLNAFPNKYKQAYRFANKGHYAYGLPKSSYSRNVEDITPNVQAYLEQQLGHSVQMLYAHIEEANHAHFMWHILMQKYGYNPDSNELEGLTAQVGEVCFLKSAHVRFSKVTLESVEDPTYLDDWGLSTEHGVTMDRVQDFSRAKIPYVEDPDAVKDVVRVTYEYLEHITEPTPSVVKHEVSFDFDFLTYIASNAESADTYTAEHTYVMACYQYEDAGVQHTRYVTYIYGSGEIDAYENLLNFQDATGEYFPRIYARLNSQKLDEDQFKDTPEFKSSVRMAKQMGLDWKNLVDSIHSSIEDLSDIQQIILMECAPVNSEDPVICEYLFRYFKKIFDENTEATTTAGFGIDPSFENKQGQVFTIKDKVYTQIISYNTIGFKVCSGHVMDVGHYSSTYMPFRLGSRVHHQIRYQVSEDTYHEIRIYGLSSQHLFDTGGTTVTGQDEALVVPLDRSALPHMNSNELEILFSKCFYVFINVMKVMKTKWYQRGAFKVVMAVIAIVISVATVGAGAPLSAYIYVAVTALAMGTAVSYGIGLLSKVLVKLGVSVKAVAVLTVIATIVATLGGNFKGIDVSAKTLLQVANLGFKVATQMNALKMQEVLKQMDAFQTTTKEKIEKLQEAQHLLDNGIPIEFEILMGDLRSKVLINFGESPEMFYARTVEMSGNVGTLCFEMISTYVDTSIQFPTFQQTYNQIQRI